VPARPALPPPSIRIDRMVHVELSALPATSTVALVARSSDTAPEFVLADRPAPRVIAARWHRRAARLDVPARLDWHLLSYCERGGAQATITLDGVCRRARQHTGSVTFLPAGCEASWTLDSPADACHVHLYLADEVLREAIGAPHPGPSFAPTPLLNVRDPWLDGFFRLMMAEQEACRSSGRLQDFDLPSRLAGLLARRLLARQEAPPGPAERSGHAAALRPMLLREIESHVERHLGERVTLVRLASLASMSVDHFVRAFARATGSTPHRWILERRLDAARERMRHGHERLAVVARECGFSGPSHLSSAFHRRYGVTPTAFRRGEPP
jgi:AraC family transcriptional regulator